MPDVFTLSVPDMSCGHCRASIEAALKPAGGVPVNFDMAARRVTIAGPMLPAAAVALLDEIGFPAEPV